MYKPRVMTFTGVGETMIEAVEEAAEQMDMWLIKEGNLISDQFPMQMHTAATASVVDIPEGLTVTCTHTITLLYGQI